ncbi:hypothetical protein [Streptomyces violaceorubidus]|uniref:hypothetical protein n=1 Tax=Streptomyces violaceorubidus TaxID=284042 RepID=UPI000A6AEC75|nr:hypothetical protein [Streptomyces violaceorubidus]
MQNRIRPVQHSTTSTTQADEALHRVRVSKPSTEPLPTAGLAALKRLEQALKAVA